LPVLATAQNKPVQIRPDIMAVPVETPSGTVEISRIQDNANVITQAWAKTSRPCPPFCIQPMQVAEGVTTIGELELMEMLKDADAIVADARTYKWFSAGTIPGAVHMPYTEVADRLEEFGCEVDFDGWECKEAKPVALFCNGNWCGQSPTAIRAMLGAGYPADRISYYRGGMHAWRMLGLTVVVP
jgi:rhodanese-related sulfurtransferase